MVCTSCTCGQVSPPNAPAFIASAPPKVPGMPAKNCAGPKPHLTHWRAIRAQVTPASARTRVSLRRASSSSVPWVLITTPCRPPSRTSTLLPSPIQCTGTSAGKLRKNAARSLRSRGLKNTSAGPPTCQEVCRLMASARRTRGHEFWGDGHDHDDLRRLGTGAKTGQAAAAARAIPRSCCRRPWSRMTSPSRITSFNASASCSTFSTNSGSS